MVWYSRHSLGFAIFVPMAVAGALLPHLVSSLQPRNALLGVALLLGGMASVMTSFGMGSSFLPALWALSSIVAAPSPGRVRAPGAGDAPTALPTVISAPAIFFHALSSCIHFCGLHSERDEQDGHVPVPLCDVIFNLVPVCVMRASADVSVPVCRSPRCGFY